MLNSLIALDGRNESTNSAIIYFTKVAAMSSPSGDRPSLRFGDIVSATINLREGNKYRLRPMAKAFDGQRLRFFVGYPVNDDALGVTREAYAGELAMMPIGDCGWPYGWIASGDLTDITPEP
jgi:hypothetical protein